VSRDLPHLSFELRDDIAMLQLNRPEKHNAINDALLESLGKFSARRRKARK
jgi:enoyl-CoA hydratase/carnithine racemase